MIHQGIILRNYAPWKYKCSVLDSTYGKIEAGCSDSSLLDRLPHGAHISYELRKWRTLYVLADVDLLDAPYGAAPQNLLFFHHVLELCLFFLPLESACQEIYLLVGKLYATNYYESELAKKLFLYNFFLLLGMYPEEFDQKESVAALIQQVKSNSQSQENMQLLELKLEQWLLSCITLHPNAHQLKTIEFLRTMKAYDEIDT